MLSLIVYSFDFTHDKIIGLYVWRFDFTHWTATMKSNLVKHSILVKQIFVFYHVHYNTCAVCGQFTYYSKSNLLLGAIPNCIMNVRINCVHKMSKDKEGSGWKRSWNWLVLPLIYFRIDVDMLP